MRKNAKLAVVVMVPFLLVACGTKPIIKSLLAAAAISAKERAVTYAAFSEHITAKDPKETDDVRRFVAAHRKGLASDAKSLHDFCEALKKSNGIKGASKRGLKDLAKIAQARAENYAGMKSKFVAEGMEQNEWDLISETHCEALVALAELYARLDAEVNKAKKKED